MFYSFSCYQVPKLLLPDTNARVVSNHGRAVVCHAYIVSWSAIFFHDYEHQ